MSDGTCVPSCPNTPHNNNSTICTNIPNCTMPSNGSPNCTCSTGLVENRFGECDTACGKTTYNGGNECTTKIGCENPANNRRG